jgi:hypothetical protein
MPVEGERRICGPGGVSWALDVVPDVEEALGAAWRGAGPRTLTNLRRSLQPDMIMR